MHSLLDLIVLPSTKSRAITQQSRQKQYHDYHAHERTFVVDDNVLVKNFTSNCPKWLSGRVVAVKGPVSYEIALADGNVVRRHLDHIRSGSPSQSSGGKGENHDHDFDISPAYDYHSRNSLMTIQWLMWKISLDDHNALSGPHYATETKRLKEGEMS